MPIMNMWTFFLSLTPKCDDCSHNVYIAWGWRWSSVGELKHIGRCVWLPCITVTFSLRDLSIWGFGGLWGVVEPIPNRHRGATAYKAGVLSSTDHKSYRQRGSGPLAALGRGKDCCCVVALPSQRVRTPEPSVVCCSLMAYFPDGDGPAG